MRLILYTSIEVILTLLAVFTQERRASGESATVNDFFDWLIASKEDGGK